jgi:tRNA(adenine34) deaminase
MELFDDHCLGLAIAQARTAKEQSNYPVGAVLSVGGTIIEGSNTGEQSKNYSNHAETSLIIAHGTMLLDASKAGTPITLYSSLEPCLMCLGVAVMNKINRIIYVQSDPHAGACGLSPQSLGVRYHLTWPTIVHEHCSDEPRELIVAFLHTQIEQGIRVEWSRGLLELIKTVE